MQSCVVFPLIGLFLIVSIHGKSDVNGKSKVIYVTNKHTNISVEGCTTPDLILGFYTPMKVRFSEIFNIEGHNNEPMLQDG